MAKRGDRAHIYFQEEMAKELISESNRLDRSVSWLAQYAWKIARKEIKSLPSDEEPVRMCNFHKPPCDGSCEETYRAEKEAVGA